MSASIYDHPGTYDLEHPDGEADVGFFLRLAHRHQPARILDLACGNGRVTIPLARAARVWGGTVTGVDSSGRMLEDATTTDDGHLVEWRAGDARQLEGGAEFDLVISACASLSHLLTIEDQLAAWRGVRAALRPGGRFVVAELTPDLPTLAESMRVPARANVQFDGDFDETSERLVRCRAVSYRADVQRMRVRYFYDHFPERAEGERFVNDYDAHVFFPNELRLLFLAAGYEIEEEWGSYDGAAFSHASRFLIVSGRARGAR